MAIERVELRGSARKPVPDARVIGVPDPNERIIVTLTLRRRTDRVPEPGTKTVSREEFAKRYGADADDLPIIEQFAAENDLTIVEADMTRRMVQLAGTIANMNEASADRRGGQRAASRGDSGVQPQ